MPVSKKRKRPLQTARKRDEQKRLNRIRGMIGNSDMSPVEAKAYLKAIKNKSTPVEMLNETHQGNLEILKNYNLISSTSQEFEKNPEFATAFSQAWGKDLHDEIVESAKVISDLEKASVAVVEKYREEMEALGNGAASDVWIHCMDAVNEFGDLYDLLEQSALTMVPLVTKIVKCTAEAANFAQIEYAEVN